MLKHHVGRMLDHRVADRMAMAVIDILQVFDTNKQKRELAHKSTPIERLRQFVVIGKVRDKRDTFCAGALAPGLVARSLRS